MLIFVIFGIIFVIGLILFLKYRKESWKHEGAVTTGFFFIAVSSVVMVICGILCLIFAATADLDYANMVEKRDAIIYRLEQIENEKNLLINGGVYDDIVEYNNEVRKYKKYGSSNLWTNWFNPAPIDKLDYIKLPKSVS